MEKKKNSFKKFWANKSKPIKVSQEDVDDALTRFRSQGGLIKQLPAEIHLSDRNTVQRKDEPAINLLNKSAKV